MPAIAVTDHGNLSARTSSTRPPRRPAVKPIIGIEAYVTPKTHRSERKRVRWGDAAELAAATTSPAAAPSPT